MDALVTTLYLAVPLIFSGSAHMAVVRFDVAPWLKQPIHERAFGPNKTWRGVVAMALLTIVGVWLGRLLDGPLQGRLLVSLYDAPSVPLGGALGLAYALAELPNSWWKRRQGIPSGGEPERHRALYVLADQADSPLACALVYALLLQPPASVLGLLVVMGPALHLLANATLYLAGLRDRPV